MLDMAMAVGGAFLFSMYIIYDVQVQSFDGATVTNLHKL